MEDSDFQLKDLEKADFTNEIKHSRRPSVTKQKTENYVVNLDDDQKKQIEIKIENKIRKEILDQQNLQIDDRESENSKIYQVGDVLISKEFISFLFNTLILFTILIFIITELSIKNSNDTDRERLFNILSIILGVVVAKINFNQSFKK